MELFNCKENEELWIILNAKRQIEWEKNLKYRDPTTGLMVPTSQALNPRTMEQAINISRSQLRVCIKNNSILTPTLEELLGLDRELWKKYLENNIKANGIQL